MIDYIADVFDYLSKRFKSMTEGTKDYSRRRKLHHILSIWESNGNADLISIEDQKEFYRAKGSLRVSEIGNLNYSIRTKRKSSQVLGALKGQSRLYSLLNS